MSTNVQSTEKPLFTSAADKFIEATRQSLGRIRAKAAEADALGLGVLAREYDYLAGALEKSIAVQMTALNGKIPAGFK